MKQFDPYVGMPRAIRIGNFNFLVKLVSVGESQATNRHGLMCPVQQIIEISPGQNAQNLADTFIHEVIHAIHYHFDLLDDNNQEEQITTMTAHGLCQVWQDNPKAMAWWAAVNAHGI